MTWEIPDENQWYGDLSAVCCGNIISKIGRMHDLIDTSIARTTLQISCTHNSPDKLNTPYKNCSFQRSWVVAFNWRYKGSTPRSSADPIILFRKIGGTSEQISMLMLYINVHLRWQGHVKRCNWRRHTQEGWTPVGVATIGWLAT